MGVHEDIEENHVKFIRDANEFARDMTLQPFTKIVVVGMGASGTAGDMLKILYTAHPVEVVRSSTLPRHVDKETLVFVNSYSGDTEETNTAYNEAVRKGCQIVVITSGGKLSQKCMKDRVQYIKIPGGLQPRVAVPYTLIPILNLLKYPTNLDQLYPLLESQALRDRAKELAVKLREKIPLIYCSDNIKGVAYRWKTQINENAKVHAFANTFSELIHNEVEGFTHLHGDYYLIIIVDENDNVKMKKRMIAVKEMAKKSGVSVTEIGMKGRNDFHRLMTEMYAGDLTSIYLAELNGTDPSTIPTIEQMRKV